MKTTVLLAEFLVVGLLAVAQIAWSAYIVTGWDLRSASASANIGDWVAALLVLYAIGILWGRFADFVMKPIDARLKEKAFQSEEIPAFSSATYHAALLDIHARHPSLAESMAQVRSQYRIARAAAITGLLAIATTLVQPFLRPALLSNPWEYWGLVCLLTLFSGLGVETYRHLRGHYLRWAATYASDMVSSRAAAAKREAPRSERPCSE